MKYFPIPDPVTRVIVDRVSTTDFEIILYVNYLPSGFLRMKEDEVTGFLQNVLASKLEIADIDDGLLSWHGEYNKHQVISEDGELVLVSDLTTRDD